MNTKSPVTHPPASDHVHGAVPLETAFDFLNTLELEDGALVERLTTLDDAAEWLTSHGVIRDRTALDRSGSPNAIGGSRTWFTAFGF